MRKFLVIVALALALPACKKDGASTAAEQPAPGFTVVEGTTQEAVDELKSQQEAIIKQVLNRNAIDAADITVSAGDPPGLGFTVKHAKGRKVKLEIPPSKFGAELVTNFDHTLDKAVKRASTPAK